MNYTQTKTYFEAIGILTTDSTKWIRVEDLQHAKLVPNSWSRHITNACKKAGIDGFIRGYYNKRGQFRCEARKTLHPICLECGNHHAPLNAEKCERVSALNYFKPNAPQLASQFIRELIKELTPRQMTLVRTRNLREPSEHVCHYHDFCDANVVMDEAFKKLTGFTTCDTGGEDIGCMSDATTDLWDAAWTLAKLANFEESKIPSAVAKLNLPTETELLREVLRWIYDYKAEFDLPETLPHSSKGGSTGQLLSIEKRIRSVVPALPEPKTK